MIDTRFIDLYEMIRTLSKKYNFEVSERRELYFLIGSIQDSYKVLSNTVKSEIQIHDIDTYICNHLSTEDIKNVDI